MTSSCSQFLWWEFGVARTGPWAGQVTSQLLSAYTYISFLQFAFRLCLAGMLASSVLRANGHSMCLAGALGRDLCDRNRPHLLDPGMLGSCVVFCLCVFESVMLSRLLGCRQQPLTSGCHMLLPGSNCRPTGDANHEP